MIAVNFFSEWRFFLSYVFPPFLKSLKIHELKDFEMQHAIYNRVMSPPMWDIYSLDSHL